MRGLQIQHLLSGWGHGSRMAQQPEKIDKLGTIHLKVAPTIVDIVSVEDVSVISQGSIGRPTWGIPLNKLLRGLK